MADQTAFFLLDSISVLDALEARGAKPSVMDHQMSVQSLAFNGQAGVGVALLARAKAAGVLSSFGQDCFVMFHTLLEACRLVGHRNIAAQVEAEVERLGLLALAPEATPLGHTSRPHDQTTHRSFSFIFMGASN